MCLRKATMIASSSTLNTVECASLGPVGRSLTAVRSFHLATVFWLMPYRLASVLGSLDYAVSLDGPPQSSWRSHVELVP